MTTIVSRFSLIVASLGFLEICKKTLSFWKMILNQLEISHIGGESSLLPFEFTI